MQRFRRKVFGIEEHLCSHVKRMAISACNKIVGSESKFKVNRSRILRGDVRGGQSIATILLIHIFVLG